MPTVIVYWSPGRTPQQKQRVVEEMTRTLVEQGGARAEDVLIVFQNIEAGDSGRGGKIIAPMNDKASDDSLASLKDES